MPKAISDLFKPDNDTKESRHIYTVSELTQDIKLILENTFGAVWMEAEISNFKGPSSAGHHYFSLKDENAVLQAALFSHTAREMKFKLENGLKVICYGRVEVYAPHGKYQLIVEKIEPKGIGSLQLALEQLKKKLEKEGLFSPGRKKPLPYLPYAVGIVTSAQGAAIKDMFKVFDRRFKDIHIVINPVRVQGQEAAAEIAQAINDFNRLNESMFLNKPIEAMIVGRGGGSIEDLWAFNEEIVARAIYNSKIPVISAVGHERDWTIADLVADVRAATPSVAAEILMPKKEDLTARLNDLIHSLEKEFLGITDGFRQEITDFLRRLGLNIEHNIEINQGRFNSAAKKLSMLNPASLIKQYKVKTQELARQIYTLVRHFVKLKHAEFTKSVEKLSSLSPLGILSRGYSITYKIPEDIIVKEALSLEVGDRIKTRLGKGEVVSKVTELK